MQTIDLFKENLDYLIFTLKSAQTVNTFLTKSLVLVFQFLLKSTYLLAYMHLHTKCPYMYRHHQRDHV